MESIMRRLRGGSPGAAAPPSQEAPLGGGGGGGGGGGDNGSPAGAMCPSPAHSLKIKTERQAEEANRDGEGPQQSSIGAAWGSPATAAASAAAASAAVPAPAAPPPPAAAASAAAAAAPPPAAPRRASPHVLVDFGEHVAQHRPSFFAARASSAVPDPQPLAAAAAKTSSRPPPPPGSTDGRARDLALKGEGLLCAYPLLPHALRREKWRLRHFGVLATLHRGYASNVYKARCNLTGETVVLKIYMLAGLTPLTVYQTFREVALHGSIVSGGCAALWAAWREGDAVVLAQEHAEGGDLAHALRGKYGGRMEERHAVCAVVEPLLAALQYLHARGIAHRDIKPENLLLAGDGSLKLADFGLSIDLGSESAVTRAGTLDYMAPEVVTCPLKRSPSDHKLEAGTLGYGSGVDVWSVGVLAYELVAGATPFRSATGNKEHTAAAIQRGLFGPGAAGGGGKGGGGGGGPAAPSAPFAWPPRFSDELKAFVTAALQPDPARRPSALELAQHGWVRKYRRPASQASIAVPPPPLAPLAPAQQQQQQQGAAGAAKGRAPRATVDEVGRGMPHVSVSPLRF